MSMKYPLPRKKKKALKNGDCKKSILFEIVLEYSGPKAAVRMLNQWGRVQPEEVFERELADLTREDGMSVRDKERVREYATSEIIKRTPYRKMRGLASEALNFSRTKNKKCLNY